MWLVTTTGFFSVVLKPGDTDLCIRARVRKDLVALKRDYLPSMGKIIETKNADYRFRAYASREGVAYAAADMARDIDYSNFKDEVKAVQGKDRANVYMRIWTALLELDPRKYTGAFWDLGKD